MDAITLIAIIIAAGTLIFSAVTIRRRAGSNQVVAMDIRLVQAERRIEKLESELAKCHEARKKLQGENIELMRRLVAKGE